MDPEVGASSSAAAQQSPLMTGDTKSTRAKRTYSCLLHFCRLVNVVTAICATLCLISNAMAVAVGPSLSNGASVKEQVLRVYGVVIAAGIVVTESEWHVWLAYFRVMDVWLFRGLVQAFEAVLTLQLAHVHLQDTDFIKSLNLYRTVAGYSLLCCAAFYVAGGVLCVGWLKQVAFKQAMKRQKLQAELDALEKQREEVNQLLSRYGTE